MSQHSFSISNEAGAAFRADVNSALQALASCSRGATAPSTTYAGQVWDDSTANVQKKRNAANSAWIVKMTLDETFVLARASNTILGLSDIGKSIIATSSFTQTLTAAATLGDGWWVNYRNNGSGVITIDPNGAETIDGAATTNLNPGEGITIVCNGSAFYTVGRVNLSPITNSLAADVNLNNTSAYFTGPSVAQGTSGTWFASGTVTVKDTAGAAIFLVKLWDGTSVIASATVTTSAVNSRAVIALSGFITNPAGNIRISVKDVSSTSGLMEFNASAESKDCTLTAIRIA